MFYNRFEIGIFAFSFALSLLNFETKNLSNLFHTQTFHLFMHIPHALTTYNMHPL